MTDDNPTTPIVDPSKLPNSPLPSVPPAKDPPVEMVGGWGALFVLIVLLGIIAAVFAIMWKWESSIPYCMGFLGATLVPAILAYQNFQGYKTRKAIAFATQLVNQMSHKTADAAATKVIKEAKVVAKEVKKDLNKLSGKDDDTFGVSQT